MALMFFICGAIILLIASYLYNILFQNSYFLHFLDKAKGEKVDLLEEEG